MNREEKRKLEKKVAKVGLAFTNLPPSQTREGHAKREIERYKLERAVQNPAFRREFITHYSGFADFLKRYDISAIDFKEFMNTDMRKLVKRLEK